MTANPPHRPLKVCFTCRDWSYKHKGLCARLNQGVGRFWTCQDWRAAADHPDSPAQTAEAPGPATP